eukprot:scaffold37999_cov17-Tisochrysis_lutea.AAC.2
MHPRKFKSVLAFEAIPWPSPAASVWDAWAENTSPLSPSPSFCRSLCARNIKEKNYQCIEVYKCGQGHAVPGAN